MIRAIGLTRRFGTLTALDRLDLEIPRGEIFGLVGPDGAGKTPPCACCAGCSTQRGPVEVAGHDVAREPDAIKDRIGYMAQRFGLYADLTVRENMLFYADLFGVTGTDRDQLMAQLLHMTRMDEFRGRQAGKLSGGMKQKLALMCTLLHHPQVLFLDEPTNGVDPVSRRDFWPSSISCPGRPHGLRDHRVSGRGRALQPVGLIDRGRLIRAIRRARCAARSPKSATSPGGRSPRGARIVLAPRAWSASSHSAPCCTVPGPGRTSPAQLEGLGPANSGASSRRSKTFSSR